MTTTQKVIGILLGLWLVALTGYMMFAGKDASVTNPVKDSVTDTVGDAAIVGAISAVNHFEQGIWWLKNAVYFGTTQQMSIDRSGNLTTTGTQTVNGVTFTTTRLATLYTSTTTPCSLQSPAATTTLRRFAFNVTTSTSTATAVTLTKGTAMQASTTALSGSFALAAGAQGTFIATTTNQGVDVIAPNTWLQANMMGGAGTVSPAGSCSADFATI